MQPNWNEELFVMRGVRRYNQLVRCVTDEKDKTLDGIFSTGVGLLQGTIHKNRGGNCTAAKHLCKNVPGRKLRMVNWLIVGVAKSNFER